MVVGRFLVFIPLWITLCAAQILAVVLCVVQLRRLRGNDEVTRTKASLGLGVLVVAGWIVSSFVQAYKLEGMCGRWLLGWRLFWGGCGQRMGVGVASSFLFTEASV